MTIKKFIYELDDDSVYAEYDEQGNVYIYDSTYDLMMARLESESSVWEVEDDSFTMSPSLLRLMAELADTPPAKRKERSYVILNSKSHNQSWCYFTIGDQNEFLVTHNTTDPEELAQGAYTRETLERLKRWLPERWRNAIESMLTPLEVALKEGKGNDHMEQD